MIYTYSVVYSSSEQFKGKTPYLTAILEAEDGTRFPAFLDGYQEEIKVSVGQLVELQETDGAQKAVYRLAKQA